MKTLIVALNSKYIHSSLAVRYLKESCSELHDEINILEFTINDQLDSILSSIYLKEADIVAFSCYIWNISMVLSIAECLKKVSPDLIIVLGGPEVSYNAEEIMREDPSIDYIVSGEGEVSFKLLLESISKGSDDLHSVEGLTYRSGEAIITNHGFNLIKNLDTIPSPYTSDMLGTGDNRIIYYETSRGCPFSCSYCISSTFEGVRYFSMNRVKSDLLKLIKAKVKQIKFVDRTFNCHKNRAKEIFEFIIENVCETNFHFEVAADLFDDEMLLLLTKAPKGLIQFEIGIQTTNSGTFELINRKTSLEKVFTNILKLKALGNFHLHVDLIAGLPSEDFVSFKKSFNEVYALKPEQLQLGFLKMLKGSKIRNEAHKYRYQYKNYPPYEILCNECISYDEILELKGVEEVLERYYNSGKFVISLAYIINHFFSSSFEFYYYLSRYFEAKGYFKRSISSRELYTILFDCLKEMLVDEKELDILNDLMKLDFLASDNSNNLPSGIRREVPAGFNDVIFEFLRNTSNIELYLPTFKGESAKSIFKKVHMELFHYDITEKQCCPEDNILLFDYSQKDKVTGLYRYKKINAK